MCYHEENAKEIIMTSKTETLIFATDKDFDLNLRDYYKVQVNQGKILTVKRCHDCDNEIVEEHSVDMMLDNVCFLRWQTAINKLIELGYLTEESAEQRRIGMENALGGSAIRKQLWNIMPRTMSREGK